MTSSVEIITTAIRAAKPKCVFQTYVAPVALKWEEIFVSGTNTVCVSGSEAGV